MKILACIIMAILISTILLLNRGLKILDDNNEKLEDELEKTKKELEELKLVKGDIVKTQKSEMFFKRKLEVLRGNYKVLEKKYNDLLKEGSIKNGTK